MYAIIIDGFKRGDKFVLDTDRNILGWPTKEAAQKEIDIFAAGFADPNDCHIVPHPDYLPDDV